MTDCKYKDLCTYFESLKCDETFQRNVCKLYTRATRRVFDEYLQTREKQIRVDSCAFSPSLSNVIIHRREPSVEKGIVERLRESGGL